MLGAVTLVGCSSGSSGGADGSGTEAAGDIAITFVSPDPKFPQWRAFGDCLDEAAEDQGVSYSETGPSGTGNPASAMVGLVQQAVANKASAVMTFPASEAFGPLLADAQKKGVVTTTVYGSGQPGSGADVNVGIDFTALGKLYVDEIAKRPGEQKVGLVVAAETGVGGAWTAGVEAAAAETDNVTVVGSVFTGDDASKALAQATALVTAHPEVNVIATHTGSATPGVVAALKAKGLTDEVAFLGNGASNGGAEALAAGTAYRVLLQDACGGAADALAATVAAVEAGEPGQEDAMPVAVTAGAVMASEDDVASYTDKGWG